MNREDIFVDFRGRKIPIIGRTYLCKVKFTLNNVFVTLCSHKLFKQKRVIFTVSCGILKIRGKQKNSYTTVYTFARYIALKCLGKYKNLYVTIDFVDKLKFYLLKPFGRGLGINGLNIVGFFPKMSMSHNGLRKKKAPRK